MEEEAKKYWQNLSPGGRIELFKHSEFDDVFVDPIRGIYDWFSLDAISVSDWNELNYKYKNFVIEVYYNNIDDILHYNTRADNWNELSNKEKEERLSGKEIETPGFVDLNKVPFE